MNSAGIVKGPDPQEPNVGTSLEATPERVSRPHYRRRQRRTKRFRMKGSVGILVDEVSSYLVDLSIAGAQLVTPSWLHPGQTVRIVLLDGSAETRCRGLVVWSASEPIGAATQYRGGVQFVDAETDIIEAFCARNGQGYSRSRRKPTARGTED